MSLNIALYIRVSTEEQALKNEGSLESQRHRMTGFVDIKNSQAPGWGMVVDSYVDDGYSAKDTNRPALQRMLKDMKNGRINMVLVADLSRMSRSIRDFCQLYDFFKEHRVKFLSLKEQFDTTTAAGEMMLFNIINLAQFERRQVSERVSLNFHSRALRGLRNGGSAPIGFRVDPANKSVWKVNENEVGYVRSIFDAYISEGSLFRAAEKLRTLKIPNRSSVSKGYDPTDYGWNTDNLVSVLRNYAYVGQREVNKMNKSMDQETLASHEKYQVVQAAWPGIVDEKTFFFVQKMIDENHSKERNRLESAERRIFLFSGISTCAECGRALVGQTGHGKKSPVRYYAHAAKANVPVTCAIKRFRADENEDAVVQYLFHLLQREGYFDGLEKTFAEIQGADFDLLVSQKRDFEKAIQDGDLDIKNLIRTQIRTEDEDLHQMYSDQLKELKDKRTENAKQLERVKSQLAEYQNPNASRRTVEKNFQEFRSAWQKAQPGLRKRLFKTLVYRLVFHADGVDVFFHTANPGTASVPAGVSAESTGVIPVDFSEAGKAKFERKKKPAIAYAMTGTNFSDDDTITPENQGENACVGFLQVAESGGWGRNRTADTCLFRALLYRLSYPPEKEILVV